MTLKCNNHVIVVLMASLCVLASEVIHGQSLASPSIDVTMRKTSTIVFPFAIKSGDRGSNDILVQKAKGTQNVLKVKAGRINFPETNLTVITEDGLLHHYLIRFSDQPQKYVFYSDSLDEVLLPPHVHLSDGDFRRAARISKSIVAHAGSDKVSASTKNRIGLVLRGIYIDGNTLYFHLAVKNKSAIPYDIDLLQFLVRDKQRVKRMAAQETIEEPTFVYGAPSVVAGRSAIDLVYAIPKFTIPDAKNLVIQLMENRGGRHLQLELKNRAINRAYAISMD